MMQVNIATMESPRMMLLLNAHNSVFLFLKLQLLPWTVTRNPTMLVLTIQSYNVSLLEPPAVMVTLTPAKNVTISTISMEMVALVARSILMLSALS